MCIFKGEGARGVVGTERREHRASVCSTRYLVLYYEYYINSSSLSPPPPPPAGWKLNPNLCF